jgi:AcrR family transcriptional regulator
MSKKPKLSAAEKKKVILEASIQLLAEVGPHAFKNSEIAKRAKIDQPLISYYFPNFETLFSGVVQIVLEDLRSAMLNAIEAGGEDPERTLANYMVSPLRWTVRSPQLQTVWLYFYTLIPINKEMKALNSQIRKIGRERIQLLIYKILEKRDCRLSPNYTVATLAYSIQCIITGYLTMQVTEDSNLEQMEKLSFQNALDLIDKAFIKN